MVAVGSEALAIFEYVCKECQHHFEAIMQGSTVPECPACKSRNLDRQLSVFAVGGRSAKFDAPNLRREPAGTCGDPRGPGSCSIN